MKYRYTGNEPMILTTHNKEVQQNGDIIEVDTPIDSVFFILVEELKSNKKEEAVN